jgi:hypothetical protein
VFYYTVGQADVVQADKVGYNKCNATNAIYNYSKGRSFTFQLNETKTYYVCSYGYCGGMRLAIKAESCRRRPRQPPLRRLREVPRGRHLRRRRRAGRTPQDGLAGKNLPAGPFVWFELGLLFVRPPRPLSLLYRWNLEGQERWRPCLDTLHRPCLDYPKSYNFFFFVTSIFGRMHGAVNVDKKNN